MSEPDELDRRVDELMEHAYAAMGELGPGSETKTPSFDHLVRADLRKYLEGRVRLPSGEWPSDLD